MNDNNSKILDTIMDELLKISSMVGATNEKVDNLEKELKAEINEVKTEISEVKAEINEVKTEMNEVRTEMHTLHNKLSEKLNKEILDIAENHLMFIEKISNIPSKK